MEPEFVGETDNCPVCGTTVVLEYGSKAGAFEGGMFDDSDADQMWGVCKLCEAKFRRREEHSPIKSFAYYEVWKCLTPEIDLKFVKFRPRRCGWKLVKTKEIPQGFSPDFQSSE